MPLPGGDWTDRPPSQASTEEELTGRGGTGRWPPKSPPSPVIPEHAQGLGAERCLRMGSIVWKSQGCCCDQPWKPNPSPLCNNHLALISPQGSMCEQTAGSCVVGCGCRRELQDNLKSMLRKGLLGWSCGQPRCASRFQFWWDPMSPRLQLRTVFSFITTENVCPPGTIQTAV